MLLKLTQGEERRQQKQQNKGRRVSVGGEIQVKKVFSINISQTHLNTFNI